MQKNVKFLFWNIRNSGDNLEQVLLYGEQNNIDIIALCEMPGTSEYNLHGYNQIMHIDQDCDDIGVFVRTQSKGNRNYYREKQHFCLFRLQDYGINLVVMHLNSSLYSSGAEGRILDIRQALEDIERIENKYGDKHTLIIGDMNVGLFDKEMLSFTEFNACLFKYQIKQKARSVHGVKKDWFYNPMLQVYKDNPDASMPKGTYYYGKSPRWYCYDHILMKYDLIPCFRDNSLMILNQINNISFVKNHVAQKGIADHMPLAFEMEV